jgi:hypothetical protein
VADVVEVAAAFAEGFGAPRAGFFQGLKPLIFWGPAFRMA